MDTEKKGQKDGKDTILKLVFQSDTRQYFQEGKTLKVLKTKKRQCH